LPRGTDKSTTNVPDEIQTGHLSNTITNITMFFSFLALNKRCHMVSHKLDACRIIQKYRSLITKIQTRPAFFSTAYINPPPTKLTHTTITTPLNVDHSLIFVPRWWFSKRNFITWKSFSPSIKSINPNQFLRPTTGSKPLLLYVLMFPLPELMVINLCCTSRP